ncbi:MAG TPA: tetratricopeptide repeat protein [Anaerolineae bacterium]|nr:tetratricopeptide repeat protein [Anaerolineae bacterium]
MMGKRLIIRLLGGVEIGIGDEPVALRTRKMKALLVFLAMHKRPFAREQLAELLWDDRELDQALANLRSLLSGLRRSFKPWLHIDRQTVAFNHDSHYWLDVNAFTARLEQAQAGGETNYDALAEAAALYRSAFLEGFYIREARQFEEWALLQREHLQWQAINALLELLNRAQETYQPKDGIEYAARLLQLDPFNERVHRQLMLFLARDGRRHAALTHYKQLRRMLAREMQLAPMPETEAVYRRIETANPDYHNLPPAATAFIGRLPELAWIEQHLARSDCRLVTISGPGGIGKTRLAQTAARAQVGRFLNGVVFTPLAGLQADSAAEAEEAVATAVAASLGLSFQGQDTAVNELINYLRQKEILLALDNFEHLLAAGLLRQILREAAAVKLVVTSRERLHLPEEHLLDLHGLPQPAEDTADVFQYEAAQLFAACAARAGVAVPAAEEDAAAVRRICRLTRGVPLALELAAGWSRALTCAEIVAEIENELSFLASNAPCLPERHRSMQAVFDHSWQMLTAGEQAAARRLSILHGAFGREAAVAAADVSLVDLLALVDKSLLRREGGYFSWHELLRQYAAARLAERPSEKAAAQEARGRYYARFLQRQEAQLGGAAQTKALDAIHAEIDNVHAAWRWAVRRPLTPAKRRFLDDVLESLYLFYWLRSWLQEGYAAFGRAAAAAPDDELLAARIKWRQGEFGLWLGHYEEAEALFADAIAVLRCVGQTVELAKAVEARGRLHYWRGQFVPARHCFAESLRLSREAGFAAGQAQALNSLANVLSEEAADYETARRRYAESLALYRQLGDEVGIAKLLLNQGVVAQMSGEYVRAKQLYEESLQLYRETAYQYGVSAALSHLGQVAMLLEAYDEAQVLLEQSLALHRESGNRPAVAAVLRQLGRTMCRSGQMEAARQYLAEALRLAHALRSDRLSLEILTDTAVYLRQTDRAALARAVLDFVQAECEDNQELLVYVQAVAADFATAVSPADLPDIPAALPELTTYLANEVLAYTVFA